MSSCFSIWRDDIQMGPSGHVGQRKGQFQMRYELVCFTFAHHWGVPCTVVYRAFHSQGSEVATNSISQDFSCVPPCSTGSEAWTGVEGGWQGRACGTLVGGRYKGRVRPPQCPEPRCWGRAQCQWVVWGTRTMGGYGRGTMRWGRPLLTSSLAPTGSDWLSLFFLEICHWILFTLSFPLSFQTECRHSWTSQQILPRQ